MVSAKLIKIIPVDNVLGEGIQWHQGQQAFWWTDIQSAILYRYCMKNHHLDEFEMPERVGCFSFIEGSEQLLIAFASGIALYDLTLGIQTWLDKPESDKVNNRFNDGRTDRDGNFWAGTIVETATGISPDAALYRSFPQQTTSTNKLEKVLANITVSNGLCWDLTGSKMYHADSPTRQIKQFDVCSKSGQLTAQRTFAQTPLGSFPDGATVDSENCLWSAHWGGNKVVRYNENGEVTFELHIPVSQPSCIALGGENFDILAVTSAKQDLNEATLANQPLAGNVFLYQLSGVKGVPESLASNAYVR